MDVDGTAAEVEHTSESATRLAAAAGALEIRVPRDEAERLLMWKGRKSAFAAMGRISRNYFVQDGVIPRSEIARVLREIGELSRRFGLRVANVFHAGDGNLHPLVLYDARVPGQEALAEELGGEILRICIRSGGSITGEHGVGADKAPTWRRCSARRTSRRWGACGARSTRNNRFNPGKVFPTPRLCGDRPGPTAPIRSRPAESSADDGNCGGGLRLASRRSSGRNPRHASGGGLRAGERRRGGGRARAERPRRAASRLRRRPDGPDELGRGPVPSTPSSRRADSPASSSTHPRTRSPSSRRADARRASGRARKGGQRLALDPPQPERATIGGIVAANAFGPLRARFGSVRDLIIGISFVRADGTLARGGGKVVKNVAGFDLPKLMTGRSGPSG